MTAALPTGTVTFVFTDIEGSTRLVQELDDRWPPLLERHDAIAAAAVTESGGVIIRSEGDAVFAVFQHAVDAVLAAVRMQQDLSAEPWPEDGRIRVRIGIHTGNGVPGGADYVGLDVHRAARIASTPHGGQTVLSESTASLVERHLPKGVELLDLGKHRLKDLTEREAIFQVVAEGLQPTFPPLRSLERVAHNLPVQVTSFIGRESEIAEATRFLQSAKVLTLLGPGGTGKTRLSLQIAAECAEQFSDGAFFVPLATVSDPDLVPSAILSALGVPASTRNLLPREHLIEFFADRAALLVLDNLEQIIEAGAVVADLVKASAGSRVLVTSRIPLRIAGEQEMPIAPLGIGDRNARDVHGAASIPAVNLFVDRAVAVRPDFVLTADNVGDVVELVRRVDGLPLAIELVVPQLRMLPVRAVLERLDPSRLGGSVRDAPERHQTLWNAISWSVEDLSEAHRRLFARLGVFAGGARLEEVESVCGDLGIDLVDGLSTLIERSLLLRDDSTDDIRFRWLRVIREYAIRLLDESGEREESEARHAVAYVDLAEEAQREIFGDRRRRWMEALDRDHDNIRGAIAWIIEHDETDLGLRMAWAIWRFWQTRGHIHEARATTERILAMEGGDPRFRAKAMEALGGILWWEGDLGHADAVYRETVERQREIGDPGEIANALYNAALTRGYGFELLDDAYELLAEAEAIYRDIGDPGGLANVDWGAGSLAYRSGTETRNGLPRLNRAIEGYSAAGNVFGEGWAHFEIGALHARLQSPDEAEPHLRDGLRLLWEARDYAAVVMFVAIIGWVAFQRGDTDRALRLMGAAYALRDQSGVELLSIEANQIEGLTLEDMDSLEDDLAAVYAEGRTMGYDEAVAYALGDQPER